MELKRILQKLTPASYSSEEGQFFTSQIAIPSSDWIMNLTLIRHGETDWNIQGKIQGQSDIPLNAKGKRQSQELKKLLPAFDRCYSSPLKRSYETALILAEGQEILCDSRLCERHYGSWDGRMSRSLIHASLAELAEIETNEAVTERVFSCLEDIATANRPDSNLLIVTHGGVIKAILSKLLGFQLEAGIKNCSGIQIQYFQKEWRLSVIHDVISATK